MSGALALNDRADILNVIGYKLAFLRDCFSQDAPSFHLTLTEDATSGLFFILTEMRDDLDVATDGMTHAA